MSRPKFFLLLNRARHSLMGRLDRECKNELDVTVVQLTALFALAKEALTAGELAAVLEVDAGATTRAVDRLVAKDLVARAVDPDDRRRRLVQLTALGTKRLLGGRTVLAGANELLTGGFTEAELLVVARFLRHADELGRAGP